MTARSAEHGASPQEPRAERLAALTHSADDYARLADLVGGELPDDWMERVERLHRPPGWARAGVSLTDAAFLYAMARLVEPERAIEIGTCAGVSTAVLAAAVADGHGRRGERGPRILVEAFDIHPFCYFDRSRRVGSAIREMTPDLVNRVRVHTHADAAEGAQRLAPERFSFGLIDADHRHPCPTADVLALAPILLPGAWIVLHDIDLPGVAERHQQRTGEGVDWFEHGAKRLFEGWPFERVAPAAVVDQDGLLVPPNIGAIRLPQRALTPRDLKDVIELPWETAPRDGPRSALGEQATGEAVA